MLMKKICLMFSLLLISLFGISQVISNPATLAVNSLPVITTQPASVTTCVGTTAIFNVVATGTDLTYQWKRGATVVAGATTATLTLANVQTIDIGNYSCTITCSCGAVNSTSASLTVLTATAITSQPINVALCSTGTATFSVNATGAGITYQWKKDGINLVNGVNISGVTTASLAISNVTSVNVGSYTVVVSGTCTNP